MAYKISRIEVWAADIRNRPGMLARVLEALSNAGAQLEFMVARRINENTSRVFVAPIKGNRQKQAARAVDMQVARGLHGLRIEGPDHPGLGAHIARAVADRGINLRGASAAALGRKVAFYVAFGSEPEATAAAKVVKKALAGKK